MLVSQLDMFYDYDYPCSAPSRLQKAYLLYTLFVSLV